MSNVIFEGGKKKQVMLFCMYSNFQIHSSNSEKVSGHSSENIPKNDY